MSTLVDTIQDAINAEPETGVQAGSTQPDAAIIETQLAQEIDTLWTEHTRLSASRKTTARELRQMRAALAERLAAMKSLLSRPGRGGQWRSWLRERHIPRSTADRLAARHAESLGSDNGNVPTGAIPEPVMNGAGAKLAEGLWPKLQTVLKADASVVEFLATIAKLSGVAHEWRSKGLMIFNPVPKAAGQSPRSTPVPHPAPQPADEVLVSTEEPAAEPATEALVGVADDCAGAVA